MNDFSGFANLAQSGDPSYCQAWEECAKHYQDSSSNQNRDLFEDFFENIFQEPQEGESRGYADDATWILTSSFVIFTMQSGFGLLESGSCSPGFEVNIMMKNIVDVVFTALTYYLVGYGISFGQPSTPFMGKGSFPADGGYGEVESGLLYSQYIFQLSFAATSTTIVSGAVAMRLKFFIYVLYSLLAVIFYSFVAHWIFVENGFLKQMGAHDFAGGAPVHVFGGVNGLVATLFLGPRLGRFDGTKPISDFFPSSPSSQCLGLLVLWWGWIGFNCGSSFGITDDRWVVAIRCAVTTINATVGGGISSIIYTLWRTKGKLVNPEHLINGILGSLVAITAACASVHTYDAFFIGAIGSLVGLGVNTFVCHCGIDDPVGAVGVHAGSGIWGLLSVGFFADSKLPGVKVMDGLLRGGGFKLLGLQVVAILCTVGWALMWSTWFFYFVGVIFSHDWRDPRKGLRADPEEEDQGADIYLHGIIDRQEVFTANSDDDSSDGNYSTSSGRFTPDLTHKSDMYARSFYRGHFDDLAIDTDKNNHVAADVESKDGDDDGSDNDEVGELEMGSISSSPSESAPAPTTIGAGQQPKREVEDPSSNPQDELGQRSALLRNSNGLGSIPSGSTSREIVFSNRREMMYTSRRDMIQSTRREPMHTSRRHMMQGSGREMMYTSIRGDMVRNARREMRRSAQANRHLQIYR